MFDLIESTRPCFHECDPGLSVYLSVCHSQNKVIPRFPELKLQPCLFMQIPSAALSRLKYGTKLPKPTRKCIIPQRGCCSLQPGHPENCRKLRVCLWKLDIRVGASLIPLSVQYFVCQNIPRNVPIPTTVMGQNRFLSVL